MVIHGVIFNGYTWYNKMLEYRLVVDLSVYLSMLEESTDVFKKDILLIYNSLLVEIYVYI